MSTVLLTGFEPFDGQPVNASWAVVREVARRWAGPVDDGAGTGADPATGSGATVLVIRRLPVSFARAPEALAALLAEHRPDLAVCVGEAGGRGKVSLERVAVNLQDARIPDEDGAQPVDAPVVPGGPVGYFSTLPVKAALLAATDAGVPTEVSQTAGTYVCNTLAYALADLLATGAAAPGARGGFVHVPRLPEQMPPDALALDAVTAAAGLTAILHTALVTVEDLPVPAGRES